MQRSRAIPVDVATAFERTLPIALPTLFSRWYGPIAPIKAVRDQSGDWSSIGQTRTVVQVGGGSMREELTQLDPPGGFGYTLSRITGPLAPLVDHIDGQWRFALAGAGTEVTWHWVVHPKSRVAAALMPAFAALWRGYARQALERLATELQA